MPQNQKTIKVTVDKSHLLTLGERMYTESIELLRELVNNAYDADATEVYVNITSDQIVVEDNGSGMNENGLEQYFNVGSKEKKVHSVSPRFGRKRIGEFGIGKFAALAAADRFEVESKKGNWVYKVVFDKSDWEKTPTWHLPISKTPATPLDPDGTKVRLLKLKKQFNLSDIQRHLIESVPIRAKKFTVFLNGNRIATLSIPGRRIFIKYKTMYGIIEGEIIVALNPYLVEKSGLECRVKGVMIKRELFGLENTHQYGLTRITGSVEADFLPFTSARNEFIKDSPEYQIFAKLMRGELEKILKDLKEEADEKDTKKITKALRDILDKIRDALKLNPDLIPSGKAIRRRMKGKDKGVVGVNLSQSREGEKQEGAEGEKHKEKAKKEKLRDKITPSIIKRLRIKDLGVACALAHLGENGPEVISEANWIFINQDHPLFKKFSRDKNLQALHLARLITQEIALMKKVRQTPREAFEHQSKLLKDTLAR